MSGLKRSRWADPIASPKPTQPVHRPISVVSLQTVPQTTKPQPAHIVTSIAAQAVTSPPLTPSPKITSPNSKHGLIASRWASDAPPQQASRSSSSSSSSVVLTPTSSTNGSVTGSKKSKKKTPPKAVAIASPKPPTPSVNNQARGRPVMCHVESTAVNPAGGVRASPFGASAKEKFERFLLIVARLKWKHPFLQRAYEQAMAAVPASAAPGKDKKVAAKGLDGSMHRNPGGGFTGEISGRVGNVVGRVGGNFGGGLDGGKEHDKVRFGGGFGGGFGGEVNWADDVEEDLKRRDGNHDQEDHFAVHQPVEPPPVEMFKLDFFEYYNLLERAVVHILAIFSESVQRTAVGANHSFHKDVISSLEASPRLGPLLVAEQPVVATAASTSSRPRSKNTALDAFILAKTLRNRWKFADIETDDRTLYGGVGDLASLDFENMLNRIFGFFDRAYELVLECNRQQRLERQAETEKPVDVEVDMGEVSLDHDAAAHMQAWDFLDSAMDWEAI